MDEVKLSDHIRNTIRTERVKHKKTGKEICDALGKHPSFISHIENDVVKTVELKDLRTIFRYILEIDNDELDNYIKSLLVLDDKTSVNIDNVSDHGSNKQSENDIVFYDKNNRTFTETGFYKILENIEYIFNQAFEKNQEYTFKSAGELMRNMHSDLGFMLGLMSAPIHLLDKLDLDTKQKLFDEIAEVIKKYLHKYAATKNDDLD